MSPSLRSSWGTYAQLEVYAVSRCACDGDLTFCVSACQSSLRGLSLNVNCSHGVYVGANALQLLKRRKITDYLRFTYAWTSLVQRTKEGSLVVAKPLTIVPNLLFTKLGPNPSRKLYEITTSQIA